MWSKNCPLWNTTLKLNYKRTTDTSFLKWLYSSAEKNINYHINSVLLTGWVIPGESMSTFVKYLTEHIHWWVCWLSFPFSQLKEKNSTGFVPGRNSACQCTQRHERWLLPQTLKDLSMSCWTKPPWVEVCLRSCLWVFFCCACRLSKPIYICR